jgi:dephospho-CoA kinase
MEWDQLLIPVISGVTIPAILAAARALWRRKRMPTGMSQRVTRRNYLSKILAMSQNDRIDRLEAVVPNLAPACGSQTLRDIQKAWAQINQRRGVRIVTMEDQHSLTAGAELLSRGIEVRVARSLNTGHISYHVFGGDTQYTVLNQRGAIHDRPEKLEEVSLSKVFHSHFEQIWNTSVPLESLLAEQLFDTLDPAAHSADFTDRFRELRAKYRLDATAEEAVLQHVAFRHCAPVIFITGLPGAGKSLVRRRLADKLSKLRFQVDEHSDYVYAFEDFLHSLMRLGNGRGTGFFAESNGAFRVECEANLQPALHALNKKVWQNRHGTPLTLVEFARSDVVAALQVFGDEVLSASQVIHVQAADVVRAARLTTRGQPPRIQVINQLIQLVVSDDHRLPSTAAKALYASDNIAKLKAQKILEGRIHTIVNDSNADCEHIDKDLDSFIENVVRPYKQGCPEIRGTSVAVQ